MCLFQQAHDRSTDRIYKKSRFSERTSRGRETGQWQHFTNSSLFKIIAIFHIIYWIRYFHWQGLKWFLFTMWTVDPKHLKTWNNNQASSYFFFFLQTVFWSCVSLFLVQSSSTEKALANQFLAPGRTPTIANERMPATKTVHMQTKARCTGEMRDELLGTVGWDARCWAQTQISQYVWQAVHSWDLPHCKNQRKWKDVCFISLTAVSTSSK